MTFSIITYNLENARMTEADSPEELLCLRDSSLINWINADALTDKDSIQAITGAYGIHPLTLEDILDTDQRPKTEEFEDYIFLTFKALNRRLSAENENGEPGFEQISLILKGNTVLTFQELPGDSFDGIRKRILNNGGRIRKMGPDYLVYAILDAVVNDYFYIIDTIGDKIEGLEDRALDDQDQEFVSDVQFLKQTLLKLRRIIGPLREALALIIHLETEHLREETKPFFKDVHDGAIQCEDTMNAYREVLAGAMEVHLSAVSNRMNSVMKVLTIISTIFIPLTFIVGVYGMNFKYMPELDLRFAYPVVWGIMAIIVLGMLGFFKKRHWL